MKTGSSTDEEDEDKPPKFVGFLDDFWEIFCCPNSSKWL
jgi:hypothetical protein